MTQIKLLVLSLLWTAASAFTSPQVLPQQQTHRQSTTTSTSTTALQMSLIKGEDEDATPFDVGAGGVRLAAESAIKVSGDVNHKPGSANPKPAELLRYTKMQEVTDAQVASNGVKIVCSGRGSEDFKDPGDTTNKEVTLSPLDAVRDAMNSAGTTQDVDALVINFLGGDDLMIMEVLNAVEQLVLNLDVKTNAKISFNSLCHTSIPQGQTTLTVVGIMNGESSSDETLRGVEASLASGEVYFRDGKYFTVVKEDLDATVA